MGVIRCFDKDNVSVTCTDDRWNSHILAEHPEMRGWEAYVIATIEKPYRIYQCPRHTKTKVLYRPFILPKPYHTQYLRVAIEYEKKKFSRKLRGYVLTAFPCSAVRKGDILIWEEQN